MMKKLFFLAAGVIVLVVGGWWLVRLQRPGAANPPTPNASVPSPGSNSATTPVSGKATNTPAVAAPADNRPKVLQPKISLPFKDVDPALRARVASVLEDLKKQYGYAGALSWDEAKALIARRDQATKALLDQLAALGPGGARAIGDAYAQTDDMRAKMLLIDALGKIQDSEAGGILQALLSSESSFNLQREMIAALGQRQDAAAFEALGEIAASQTDPRLRFAVADALNGQADALPVLAQLIQTETDPNVQKELIRSAGAIGNDAALRLLADIAQSTGNIDIRESAIQGLGRSSGAEALGALKQLLADPNEVIRENVLTALANLHSDGAVSLLQQEAASDSSVQVREQAQALLSGATR
jgi:HEAT repeat protein